MDLDGNLISYKKDLCLRNGEADFYFNGFNEEAKYLIGSLVVSLTASLSLSVALLGVAI